jgi:4'-phosphopantetheinyl transferase
MMIDTIPAWPTVADAPPLARGDVHLWCWSLDATEHELAAARTLLSVDERARADRFVFERDRRRYVVAHARMRELLARYLRRPPASLEFRAGEHGKPDLVDGGGLRFNLSHSNDLALLAVGVTNDLGVDVERIRRMPDNLAERFFAEEECRALAALRGDVRMSGFFSCWTRKEALLKGIGTGLSGGLDSFAVSLLGDGPARIVASRGAETDGWRLEHLEPAEGYVGALAVQGPWSSTRRFTLSRGAI